MSSRSTQPNIALAIALATIGLSDPRHASADPPLDNGDASLTADDRASESSGLIDGVQFHADFRYLFGGVDGYLQTPSGGAPGTTSHNRPSLDELGFHNVNIFDGALSVQFDAHVLLLGAQIVRLDGSDTLKSDLITQSTVFPAGTRESAKIQLDWYRIGYEYQFQFDLGGNAGQLRIAPGIEAVLLDFDYQLNAPGNLRAHRAYAKGGARIGGTAQWLTGSPISIEANGFWGLPIDGTAQILSVDLVGKYQLWGARKGWGGAVYLGVGYEKIEYQDNQTVPNHINVNLGPLLVAGVEIRF